MVHSDNHGLVLPPKIAPFKVIIIPIGEVDEKLSDLKNKLNEANITYKTDETNKRPGYKFAEAEVKGYPIRIELGKRDLENNQVTLVRRDTLEKINVTYEEIIPTIKSLLETMQNDMYNKAKARRDKMIYDVKEYNELLAIAKNKPGFVKINWCGNSTCEDKIKEDTAMKSRCIIEDEEVTGPCVVCGKKATTRLYVGKQY